MARKLFTLAAAVSALLFTWAVRPAWEDLSLGSVAARDGTINEYVIAERDSSIQLDRIERHRHSMAAHGIPVARVPILPALLVLLLFPVSWMISRLARWDDDWTRRRGGRPRLCSTRGCALPSTTRP